MKHLFLLTVIATLTACATDPLPPECAGIDNSVKGTQLVATLPSDLQKKCHVHTISGVDIAVDILRFAL